MDIKKIKDILLKEKNNREKGSLYYYSQINFSYNSNRIEGSKLTEEQTESIYNTHTITIDQKEIIDTDDIIETKNHFKLFDFILDNVDKDLTIDMILKMHKILKRNTTDEDNKLMGAGCFKTLPNTIGSINEVVTVSPKEVESKLNELIKNYLELGKMTLENIIEFHYKFELIHPFSDGNGRIGRIIMFKECLKNNILPFIISDEHKTFYLRGLNNYKKDKLFLIDTCKNAQDIYEKVCELLLEEK